MAELPREFLLEGIMRFTRTGILTASVIGVAILVAIIAFNFPEIDYYAFGEAVLPADPIEVETDLARVEALTVAGQAASQDSQLQVPAESDVDLEVDLAFQPGAWQNKPPGMLVLPPPDQRHLPLRQLRTQLVCRSSLGSGQRVVATTHCQVKQADKASWRGVIKSPSRTGNYFLQFIVRARHSHENYDESKEYVLCNVPLRVD